MKQPIPCARISRPSTPSASLAAQQDRRARARHLAHGAAVERQPGLVGAEREVHAGHHPQLAGARVEAREERLAGAGHARRVVHHAAVHLVRLERAGHRLGGSLEPQLVPGAPGLGLEQRRALHGHRREVGHHLDAPQVARVERLARGRARPAGSRRAGAPRRCAGARRSPRPSGTSPTRRGRDPRRAPPSGPPAGRGRPPRPPRAGAAAAASARERPPRARAGRAPAPCSPTGWRASLSSGVANQPAARSSRPRSSSTVTKATASTRSSARMSSTRRAEVRSLQPSGPRLDAGGGRVLEVKGGFRASLRAPRPCSLYAGFRAGANENRRQRCRREAASASAPKAIL